MQSSFSAPRLHVLLAEDHPINRRLEIRMLEKAGATVDAAEDGAQALRRYAEAPVGTYDVFLTDLTMPVLDGYAAARAIRTSGRSDADCLPIIALSANASEEELAHARCAGVDAQLEKPVSPQALYQTLLDCLREKTSRHADVSPSA